MRSYSGQTKPRSTLLTKRRVDQEVLEIGQDPPFLPEFPRHSLGVERCVKLVARVATAVFGQERLYALILNLQAAREA